MSERLDVEDVQAIMGRIFKSATGIIERYGGRVDKLLGDAVMAVFGDPVAHEDDAERAVRAVMEIHAAVDEMSPAIEAKIGRPVVMHSGINTGLVVTSASSFDSADTGPLGDTINLAARLEDLSEAGQILLGPETAQLVGNVFELEERGEHDLKGKTGLTPVKMVVGVRQTRTGPSRKQAAFVGRHEELGVLLAAVEKVQDGEGSVIGLRAEAGAGKTRLLAEFQDRVKDNVEWLEGRAYAYGETIPFAALIDLISNALGINEDDTKQSISTKLEAGLAGLVSDTDRVLAPLNRLFGLDPRPGSAIDKDSFQDRLLESLIAVIDGLCERAPTVLVLQDLHWADPSTVGIFASLIDAVRSPVVVVANYRPEFEGSLPGLREIELKALSPRQSAALVASLLAVDEPPAPLVDFVVRRTDGNPFYLEEIINSLIETNALIQTDDGWQIAGSLEDADVPTSVRGVIAARIDRLQDDRKRVLREASVVGRDFLYEVIRRVATATDTLDPSLSELETADLIRERNAEPDLEYFFKHSLTQDVAYQGLLKPERAVLHARAAAAIEVQFAGRIEEVSETLAYHFTEAGDVHKAVEYRRAAGQKAMDRYALVEAQAHYEAAYEALRDATGDEADRALVETILDWALLFYYQARLLTLGELLEHHQEVVDRLGDETLRMWWLIWRGHVAGFELDQADNLRHLNEALEIAERINHEAGIAYAKTWMIWAYFMTGQPNKAIEAADDIKDWVFAHRDEDAYPYLKSRGTLAYVMASAGRPDDVHAMSEELIAFGQSAGNNRCIAYGYQGIAFADALALCFSSGQETARRAREIAKDPIYSETANLTVAAAAVLIGDGAAAREAADQLRAAMEAGIDLPAPLFVALAEGAAMMSEGDLSAGMRQLFDTLDAAKANSRIWEYLFAQVYIGTTLARIATGEATKDMAGLARNPGFVKYLLRAKRDGRKLLEEAGDRSTAYGYNGLKRISDLELAKLLIHTGERAEAKQLLESILATLPDSGSTEGRERVEQLLAEIGT